MKIILEGYYGVQNLGDDYILYSILQTLSKNHKKKKIYILGMGDKVDYIKKYFPHMKIKIINKINYSFFGRVINKIKVLLLMRNADLYIFGGGVFSLGTIRNNITYY